MPEETVPTPTTTPEPTPQPTPQPTPEPVAQPGPQDPPLVVEDIVLPDGVTIDQGVAEHFVNIVNEFGIPRDAASALVDLQVQALQAVSEQGNASWDNVQEEWQGQIKADPEFGGAKLDGNLANISKLVDHYGDPELRDAFDLTGAGNNPHMIRFLSKIARDLGEPGSVQGRPGSTPQDVATLLYPNQGKY